MKYLTLFILTILMRPPFGQNDLQGILLDSISKEPIPFANISLNNKIKTTSDFDGKFYLDKVPDSAVVIKVTVVGYFEKEYKVQRPKDKVYLTLRAIPLDDSSNFIIWGKPKDTTFFKNGRIKTIKYSGHDLEEFYPNGQLKFKSANGSTRSWYKNGQLKSQSVLKNNHFRYKKTWYSDGQKESEGTVSWGHNDKQNEGEWIKNDNWYYWNKKGEIKNNR